jgi:catechol 2,3-dioxygenase-like lactoylglutathione lyase family enzyme
MQKFAQSGAEPLVLGGISPFFIVEDVARSRAFYTERLGFSVTYEQDDFAVLRRDEAQLFIKSIGPDVRALPNPVRHPWAKWDAYVQTSDPEQLWAELAAAGFSGEARVADTTDGQRGCTITDPDGYVLFFGRPSSK